MKKHGQWIYCDGVLFNFTTKQILSTNEFDNFIFSRKFIESEEFAKALQSTHYKPLQKLPFNEILALEITDKCNYACGYCFEGMSFQNNAFMTIDSASLAIDKLPDGSELRFFGGEPLLNFPLIQSLVWKYPQHRYSIVTNGSLITDEIAAFLAENEFSVGISYDGKDWHEKNRPSKSGNSLQEFEKAMFILEKYNVKTGICTVVTKHSIPHLYDIHLDVFSNFQIKGWAYLIAYSNCMTLADLNIFKEQIFSIIDDFPAQHLMKINDLKKWAMKISGEWPIESFCGAGICYSAITASGNEKLCPFFLREGLCSVPAIRAIEVSCEKCFIWDFCHGGCLALNKYGSDDTHKSHPFSCKKNHIYFEGGLKVAAKLFKERR